MSLFILGCYIHKINIKCFHGYLYKFLKDIYFAIVSQNLHYHDFIFKDHSISENNHVFRNEF